MASEKAIVSFRLAPEDLQALEEAAEGVSESVSEFVRRAAMLRVTGGLPIRILPNTNFSAPYTEAHFERPPTNKSALEGLVQDEFVRQI